MHAQGITWRLKVYPNGNGVAKNTYISVFLEMLKGSNEPLKYEYRVEMLNKRNPNQIVMREFASDFETGECWGYNRFFKIELLDRDGFIVSDDDEVRRGDAVVGVGVNKLLDGYKKLE